MSWRRNPPMRGVIRIRKLPMSWRRKLPMGMMRMKSLPLRTRSPETRPTPPRRGGSIDTVRVGTVWADVGETTKLGESEERPIKRWKNGVRKGDPHHIMQPKGKREKGGMTNPCLMNPCVSWA
jgi:hypothetical protein